MSGSVSPAARPGRVRCPRARRGARRAHAAALPVVLGVAADRGQRRAQLVAGVGDELAHPLLGPAAAASDCARAWNAASIWASMALSERPSRPTSVRGSLSGTRRDRSPAAMAPRGLLDVGQRAQAGPDDRDPDDGQRRPATITLTIRSIVASRLIVWLMLATSTPMTRVPLARLGARSGELVNRARVGGDPPAVAAGLAGDRDRLPALALSQAWLVGNVGPGRSAAGLVGGCCMATTCARCAMQPAGRTSRRERAAEAAAANTGAECSRGHVLCRR